jgi:hypothetical protein
MMAVDRRTFSGFVTWLIEHEYARRQQPPALVYSKDGMAYPAHAPVDSTDAIGHQIGAGLPAETVEFYGPDIPPVPPVTVGQGDDAPPMTAQELLKGLEEA